MPNPAVLFDVDGTLVDTTYLHTLAWWRALKDSGHEVAMSEAHRLVGMGSSELLTELLGSDHPDVSEAHSRHYQRMKGEITPLPGARQLIAEVSRRGATVVLATSAKEHDVEDLLRALDRAPVDHVIDSSDVRSAKPAGDIFAAALEAAGCEPGSALVVGDTVWDVVAAGRAGVGTVAVLTGGNCRAELLEAGALGVYRDAAHLLSELDRSPIGRLLDGARVGGV
ncbi:MAG TPA: HAD family hydrolase [Acidimicrobiales bacterium]|nr:HAD family hydrolase [Acidimicrobiales bacterium]